MRVALSDFQKCDYTPIFVPDNMICGMEYLPKYDCHCHILPGLDDGAQTLQESLYLAGRLAAYGFERAVCTAHSSSLYWNSPATVISACERLQIALAQDDIPLTLIPSMEYRLIPERWPEVLAKGWLLPWEGNHILIELPIRKPEKMGDIDPAEEIKRLISDGYQPVLAHPERYEWASRDYYRSLLDAGAAFQRNLGSIEGLYGPGPSSRALWLMQEGYYSFLGTDCHNKKYTDEFDKILLPESNDFPV